MNLDRYSIFRGSLEQNDTGDWCKYHKAMDALAAKDEEIKRLMDVISLVAPRKEPRVTRRNCDTCKHRHKPGSEFPCIVCDLDVRSKSRWEGK